MGRGLGPMVAVPATRPSTNRRAATAHDICMRAARTTPPLKYTRTDEEITRETNTYKMFPARLCRGVRHAHGLFNYTHETFGDTSLLFTTFYVEAPRRLHKSWRQPFYKVKCVILNFFSYNMTRKWNGDMKELFYTASNLVEQRHQIKLYGKFNSGVTFLLPINCPKGQQEMKRLTVSEFLLVISFEGEFFECFTTKTPTHGWKYLDTSNCW